MRCYQSKPCPPHNRNSWEGNPGNPGNSLKIGDMQQIKTKNQGKRSHAAMVCGVQCVLCTEFGERKEGLKGNIIGPSLASASSHFIF